MAHDVTLILGDGTGPELAEAARQCVDATGVKIVWDPQEAGIDVMERTGTPLPEQLLASIHRTRCALKAPITTPVGKGFRSVNVQLRQEFELFACIRPCKTFPGVRTFFSSVPIDLVLVRENAEDLYAGIEFKAGGAKTAELIEYINRISPNERIKTPASTTGISIKPISVPRTERIVRYAFEYAQANGRKKVTAVHKANIMKHTDGLFLATAREGGGGLPRYRVRGPYRRQHVHAVGAEAGALRRARAAQSLWRHHQRRGGRAGRRAGRGRGEYRRQRRDLRGYPRQRARSTPG